MNTKYWMVGATWEEDVKDEDFLKNGIWMLGWEEGSQYAKAERISAGDRIAIKRRFGKDQSSLRIMHG